MTNTPPPSYSTGIALSPLANLILFIVRQGLLSTLTAGVFHADSVWLRLLPIPVQVIDAVWTFLSHQNAKEIVAVRNWTTTTNGSRPPTAPPGAKP